MKNGRELKLSKLSKIFFFCAGHVCKNNFLQFLVIFYLFFLFPKYFTSYLEGGKKSLSHAYILGRRQSPSFFSGVHRRLPSN
jgi:hypothetical protein